MKKVFISADIEGIAFAVDGASTVHDGFDYERYRREMTDEVLAAAEGAHAAGAELVVVKDAHGYAHNIYPEDMPEYVQLIRGWQYDPKSMIEGIDESFDACMFVGYHNGAGQEGNSLSHTLSGRAIQRISVNGIPCSEFVIYSWLAAYYGVPTVMLTGDKALCEASAGLHPKLRCVAAQEGEGGHHVCYSPKLVCKNIRETAEQALSQDLSDALITLPAEFTVDLDYHDMSKAARFSYYPGMERTGPKTLRFRTADWYEACRMLSFVVL